MFRMTRFAGFAIAAAICMTAGPALAQRTVHVHTPETSHAASAKAGTTTSSKSTPTFIQRIDANPNLVARLKPLVPSTMTLDQAADGFRNRGQFIAALHAAHDLNIPFDQLKAEMTGTDHDSLGQAIHELKPAADAKSAVHTAEQEAKADIKATRPAKPAGTDNDADDQK
jgi:hypothetical protein